jgi:hypothetical protein
MTAVTTSRERVRVRPPVWFWAFVGHELLVLAGILFPMTPPSTRVLRAQMAFASQSHFLFRYDSLWFQEIARHGYLIPGQGLRATVFFPLIPLILHVTGPAAGLVLQQAALATVFWLLHRVLARFDVLGTARDRVLWLFAVNPAAVYFSSLYAETWMMLGMLASIELAFERRYTGAAAVGFLGSLTEAPALLLGLIPLVLVLWRGWAGARRDWPGLILWGLGIGAGVGAYAIYLDQAVGHPLAFMTEQGGTFWHGAFQTPWAGWLGPFLASGRAEFLRDPPAFLTLFLVASLMLAGVVAETIRLARQQRDWSFALALYATAMTVIAFSFGTRGFVYHSTLRFLAPVFPAYMGLTIRTPRWLYSTVAAVFVLIAFRGSALFAHGWFFQ